MFMLIEIIDISQTENVKEYFSQAHNFSDYTLFITHTMFFVLRVLEVTGVPNLNDIALHIDPIQNTALILASIILCLMVTKIQHIMSIYPFWGILN
jgi:hypothetical protein